MMIIEFKYIRQIIQYLPFRKSNVKILRNFAGFKNAKQGSSKINSIQETINNYIPSDFEAHHSNHAISKLYLELMLFFETSATIIIHGSYRKQSQIYFSK